MKGRQLMLGFGIALGMIFLAILRHQIRILPSTLGTSPSISIGPTRSISSLRRQKNENTAAMGNTIPNVKAPSVEVSVLAMNGTVPKTEGHFRNGSIASTKTNETNMPSSEKPMIVHQKAEIAANIESFQPIEEVQGMSSCLFIMDDTIRLIEWLAYHYTVLPLRYLIVGIDPHSNHPERIVQVLERWRPYMNITIWDDPQTYLQYVPWDKAWKRKYWISPGVINPLYEDNTTLGYKSQEHKRRQNIFTSHCYRQHFLANRSWVMNLDTDEFLIPNYFGTTEDANSSSFVIHYVGTAEKLERDRSRAVDIREHLPDLTKRITISEILRQTNLDRCLKIPALNFTSHQGKHAYKGGKDKTGKLLTMLQTKTGPREGRTTKAILDVSRAQLAYLTWKTFVNVHNPNKRMCGWNGVIGSGTDYISSIFRYHHYVAGSLESSVERAQDYRMRQSGKEFMEHYKSRSFEPIPEENTDIFPWLAWFLDTVGETVGQQLLFAPLERGYAQMRELLEHSPNNTVELKDDVDPF
jgi:hypothetical protein